MRDPYNHEPNREIGSECLMLILLMFLSMAFGWFLASLWEYQCQSQDDIRIQLFFDTTAAGDSTISLAPSTNSDTTQCTIVGGKPAGPDSSFFPRGYYKVLLLKKGKDR